MHYLLDTAHLETIQKTMDVFPIQGVTSNPSITKKEGKIDFFTHFKAIRNLIGHERSLHIQVTSQNCEGMLEDAQAILDKVDHDVYIKIPVTLEGLKAMRILKARGVNVTATAVYTQTQAYLALECGVDYIAPYFNRILNMGEDPQCIIRHVAQMIAKYDYRTLILGASFKSMDQVNDALDAGAQCVTLNVDLLIEAFKLPEIQKAVDDFEQDWESIYGKGTKLKNL